MGNFNFIHPSVSVGERADNPEDVMLKSIIDIFHRRGGAQVANVIQGGDKVSFGFEGDLHRRQKKYITHDLNGSLEY